MGVYRRKYKTADGKTKTAKDWSYKHEINGKPYYGTFEGSGSLTKRQATQLHEARKALDKKELRGEEDATITFNKALLDYYADYVRKLDIRREATHKRVQDRWLYIVPILGDYFIDRPLAGISRKDIVEFIIDKRSEGVRDTGIANYIDCMSATYNYAIDMGLCDENEKTPNFRSIKRLLKKGRGKRRYLSEAEYDALVRHCSDTIRPMVIFAVETGMRKEEFLSLKWVDVDMANRRIAVKDTKNGSDRTVSISANALKLLQDQIQKNEKIKSEYVFFKKNGKRYFDFKKGFENAVMAAKITDDVCIHDLRRTFGSWRLQGIRGKKMTLKEVSVVLGHTTTRMTDSTYAFLDELNIEL